MAFCTECGHPNRPGARFCQSCGTRMELLEEETGELPPPASAAPKNEPRKPYPIDAGEEWITLPGRSLPPNGPPAPAAPVTMEPEPGDAAPDRPAVDAKPAEEAVEPAAAGSGELLIDVPLSASSIEAEFAPGTLVAGRYRIRRMLGSPGGSLACEADDVLACWSCAALQPLPDLHYCESCGAVLSRWQQIALVEITAAGQPPVASDRLVQHGGKIFRVEAAQAENSLPACSGLLRFEVGRQTDAGMLRAENEDSLVAYQLTALCENLPSPQVQFFAVADGIGGSDAGEVASRTAVRALVEELHRLVVQPLLSGDVLLVESLGEHLREMVRSANRKIFEKRQEKGLDMGCTLTTMLFYGADGVIANVGDSRTYLFRAGKLAQVSTDHSVVANLVAGGIIKREEAYFHEQRNVILRSLGDKLDLEVDLYPVRAQPGDIYLLCSDGLWEMVRDNIIENVLLETHDPQAACASLVQYANQAGGEDNISVIVVDVHAQ